MAAQTPGAGVMKSAASVGHSFGTAAKVLLRGRDEDLGIDAIGNMVGDPPPSSSSAPSSQVTGTRSGSQHCNSLLL
jgi:hypothetical protein